jgi:DNA-binding NtrC family response regulator
VRKVVALQLAALGYATIQAGSAAEALEIIAADKPFDLLFTDVVMPGRMSGVDLARLAREKRPKLKVLLTSGYPDLKTRHESFQNIMMIKKPYRGDDLWRALKDVLATDA